MTEQNHDITQILQRWSDGDANAVEQLFPHVYEELRRLARNYLAKERNGHTLQPTALVHEAYLRLIDQNRTTWQNRAHFYAVAAQMMRRILVNYARDRVAQKRGGDFQISSFDESIESTGKETLDIVRLDEAMQNLEKFDERKSRVVEMRFFGGLSEKEISVVLEISEKTVSRDWTMAKMWLRRELSQGLT